MRQGVALSHRHGLVTAIANARRRTKVVSHIDRNRNVGVELLCQHAASKATDFLMACHRPEIANVLQFRLRDQTADFGGHKTTQPVVQIGSRKRIGRKATFDWSVVENRVPWPDA